MKTNWDHTESKGGCDTNGDDEHDAETCERAGEDRKEQSEEDGQEHNLSEGTKDGMHIDTIVVDVQERSRTGTQSQRMKRARHDSERSRSGTSAQSVTEGSSPPSATEVRQKDREFVLINASTPKRKETRNIPLTTIGNPRNEDRRGTEENHAKTPQPKKGKQCEKEQEKGRSE